MGRRSFMASKKHVARLRQGVEAWNQWRRENPKICPDLSRAVLIRASLSGAICAGPISSTPT
jgi:hypothetical protein